MSLFSGSKNKKIIIISGILILIAVIFILAKSPNKKSPVSPGDNAQNQGNLFIDNLATEKPEEPKLKDSALGKFNPVAPEQTLPMDEKKIEEVSKKENVFNLEISPKGILPKEFTVNRGETISLILTSTNSMHTVQFEDPSLSNVYLGVLAGETRGVSFVAPAKSGNYIFYCTQPDHRERGEAGVMRVK
ncbi:MAG: hypothetical protein AAB465_00540 [Patescibacteria group bacterium]|mgnify:CR=1 FL=1